MNFDALTFSVTQFLKENMGATSAQLTWMRPLVVLLSLVVLSYIVTALFRWVIVPVVERIVSRTKVTWDDYLFNQRVMRAFQHLLPPVLWYVFLPIAFHGQGELLEWCLKACQIYLVITALHLVSAVLHSVYEISEEHKQLRNRPLKGIYQMFNLVAIVIGVILVISILLNKSVTAVMTGLGASAAIIMLIFKDTLLGLAAGVQLTANDMLRPGDWITMPKYGVNGTVTEVTLTTVKIQNFDRTIITVPPYLLVSDSFQNWRGMKETGERRMKRSLYIDMNTIHFCSPKELESFYQKGFLQKDEIKDKRIVNLHVFRHYIQRYLRELPEVNSEAWVMVRQLQSVPEGLPIEFYCFLMITDLQKYEAFQNEIMDYILAILPEFGLRVFQRPAGADLQRQAVTGAGDM